MPAIMQPAGRQFTESRLTGLDRVTVVGSGGSAALRDVTVHAAHGELLAVLGPSGSGKTTLLRAIAGLARVRSGEVYIEGRRVTATSVPERNVAMVFESSALMPFLDVEHNLSWGLTRRGSAHGRLPEPEVRRRVSEQARGLRLSRLLGRMPTTLSAGEQGLVGTGRALVRVPSVFLLDEPLAHLDAAQRWSTCRRIVDVVKGLDVTTIYVSHDQTEALAIADRVALLSEGSVVQSGVPEEFYRRPASVFVAGFVGTPPIGLLPARPVGSSDAAGYRVGARTLPLWAPLPPEVAGHAGRPVVLGVRPEHVYDATEGCDPRLVTMPATVVRATFVGPETVVVLEVAAPPVTVPGAERSDTVADRARLRARFPRDTRLRVADTLPIAVDVAQAHVFDAVSGAALYHPAD